MKTKTKALLTVLTLGIATCVVTAQEDGPGPRGPRGQDGDSRPPAAPLHAALDANGDRVIDATEISNAVNALKSMDKNGDGKLTPDELRPDGMRPGMRRGERPDGAQRPNRVRPRDGQGLGQGPRRQGPPDGEAGAEGRPQRPVPPLHAALDANHDRVIDATELGNASTALKTLDKNGDGELTPEELRPEGREPRGPRGPRADRPDADQ